MPSAFVLTGGSITGQAGAFQQTKAAGVNLNVTDPTPVIPGAAAGGASVFYNGIVQLEIAASGDYGGHVSLAGSLTYDVQATGSEKAGEAVLLALHVNSAGGNEHYDAQQGAFVPDPTLNNVVTQVSWNGGPLALDTIRETPADATNPHFADRIDFIPAHVGDTATINFTLGGDGSGKVGDTDINDDADNVMTFDFATVPAPVAKGIAATVAENSGSTTINVLDSNFDPTWSRNLVLQTGAPAHGAVSLAADGTSIVYTPAANFSGTDTFSYTVFGKEANGTGTTSTGSISVTVTPLPPPIAQTVSADVAVGSRNNSIDVLAQASDPGGGVLTVASATHPGHGTAVVAPGGKAILYTPAPGFSGLDVFRYTIVSTTGGRATDTIFVTVNATEAGSLNVTAPPSIQARAGIVSFRGKLSLHLPSSTPAQLRLATPRGLFALKAPGVKISGNGSRVLTLTGSSAAIDRALARLTLVLGKAHGRTLVTLIASAAGRHSKQIHVVIRS